MAGGSKGTRGKQAGYQGWRGRVYLGVQGKPEDKVTFKQGTERKTQGKAKYGLPGTRAFWEGMAGVQPGAGLAL